MPAPALATVRAQPGRCSFSSATNATSAVQRAGQLGDQAAHERGADDTRGPGGEAAQEVTLAGDLGGGGGHGSPAMLTRSREPGTYGWHAAGYGYLPSWR